jgi:hypothetical protein
MRSQLRLVVCGVVIIVIAVASIVEPPGLIEAVGYIVVVAAMLAVVQRERRKWL